MSDEILVCTDGSAAAIDSAKRGLDLVRGAKVLIITVLEPLDPTMVTGMGIAGGTMTGAEYDRAAKTAQTAAGEEVARTAKALGLPDAETRILESEGAGPAICRLASDLPARGIVMGSRGRGGIRRALLGSVSDHVLRNAPCPVVITGPAGIDSA